MQQYEEFLKKIKKYFEYDEVITQGDIINAYDLVTIIQSRLGKLHDLIYSNKDLKNDIERFYRGTNIIEIIRKISKKSTPKVDFILKRCEQDSSRIYIRFYPDSCDTVDFTSLEICKDYNSDELYFGNSSYGYGTDKDFVEYFKDIFLSDLYYLEYFMEVFKLSQPSIEELPSGDYHVEEVIDDEFIKLKISYDTYGSVSSTISILPDVDPNNIYSRVWLDHPSLKEYVDEHKEEFLKRIPIDIINLNASTQKIVNDYYSCKNQLEHTLKLK